MNANALSTVIGQREVISLSITPTRVEVTYRQRSNGIYACNPPRPVPDKVWREIWVPAMDGTLQLISKQDGTHQPAHYVEETVTFTPLS